MAADLKVPVDDPVSFKVVVVLSERVDQLLRYLMKRHKPHQEFSHIFERYFLIDLEIFIRS